MKKICFHIQKGGVGKTSVSGNTASLLAHGGKKILLVDCDPQGNTSSWFCADTPEYDIADVITGKAAVQDTLCQLNENWFLLPVKATRSILKQWAETELPRSPRTVEFLISDLESLGFDYALFDCSPSLSLLERLLISCMDEVINPLLPEFFSIDGIEGFVKELQNIERANRRIITNNKLVVNLVNRSFARHRAFLAELEKLPYQVFIIPQDSKIAECQIAHKSLIEFDPRAKSLPFYRALAESLMKTEENIAWREKKQELEN